MSTVQIKSGGITTIIVQIMYNLNINTVHNCDPASQNHQKVARRGFLVKSIF